MGLWAASHNGLNQPPKTELTFDTLLKKNDLKAKVESEVKSLIEDDTKTDNVDLTNGMSEEEAIDKYIAGLSDGEKNNLIKDLLGSAVDSVVNFFANNEGEETPDVDAIRDRKNNIEKNILDDYTYGTTDDPKTVEDATKDTTMIGENEATTEDAEVDPMTAKVMEYAELDDQALYSKLSAINSQLSNPELTDEEYNTLMDEKAVIEAAKAYKQEAKVIEKMTPEQKAELEAINNEMTPIMEKIEEVYQKLIDATEKYLDAQSKAVNGEITQEAYKAIEEERDTLGNMLDSLYSQLAPLEEKRQALFDNAGKVDEAPTAPESEEEPDVEKMLSDIEDIKNNIGNYVVDNNTFKADDNSATTLADKLKEEATSGFSLFGTTTDTTTTTTSDKKDTTTKTTNNIFSKVASSVKSDDLEGVLDAMERKGMSETFTNATKVGDNSGVDFTRRQFLRAMDERLI